MEIQQQFLHLVDYTENILLNIVNRTSKIEQRISNIKLRTEKLKSKFKRCDEFLEHSPISLSLDVERKEWHTKSDSALFMFTPNTRTGYVDRIYANCRPMPCFELLDSYRKDGKSCEKLYSNPEFYYEESQSIETSLSEMASLQYGMSFSEQKPEFHDKFTSAQTLNNSIEEAKESHAISELIQVLSAPIVKIPELKNIQSVDESDSFMNLTSEPPKIVPNKPKGFLHDIQTSQFSLKKVSKHEKIVRIPDNDIAAILMRRVALADSDGNSESNDEDSWD